MGFNDFPCVKSIFKFVKIFGFRFFFYIFFFLFSFRTGFRDIGTELSIQVISFYSRTAFPAKIRFSMSDIFSRNSSNKNGSIWNPSAYQLLLKTHPPHQTVGIKSIPRNVHLRNNYIFSPVQLYGFSPYYKYRCK